MILHDIPEAGTLQVFVDEVLVTEGWSYETVSRSLLFSVDARPPSGSVVRAEYDVVEGCE